jgi:hypothetical protein
MYWPALKGIFQHDRSSKPRFQHVSLVVSQLAATFDKVSDDDLVIQALSTLKRKFCKTGFGHDTLAAVVKKFGDNHCYLINRLHYFLSFDPGVHSDLVAITNPVFGGNIIIPTAVSSMASQLPSSSSVSRLKPKNKCLRSLSLLDIGPAPSAMRIKNKFNKHKSKQNAHPVHRRVRLLTLTAAPLVGDLHSKELLAPSTSGGTSGAAVASQDVGTTFYFFHYLPVSWCLSVSCVCAAFFPLLWCALSHPSAQK